MKNETPSLPILRALDSASRAVRALHPGIPDTVITLGSGGGTTYGHFGPGHWAGQKDEAARIHELNIATEGLSRGGRGVFGTLVHELAHAYSEAAEIKDTSNGGRYHNAQFRKVAEDFGLNVEQNGSHGWSTTTVTDHLAKRFAKEIEALDEAITVHRRTSFGVAAESKSKVYQMVCPECNDPVRIGKGWFERNTPMCTCGEYFEFEVIDPSEEG